MSASLADYVRRWVIGESYSRDDVELVIRPLGVAVKPEAVLSARNPSDISSAVRGAVERRRRRVDARRRRLALASDNNNAGVVNGAALTSAPSSSAPPPANGVRSAAIEVTRGCDELSGRLMRGDEAASGRLGEGGETEQGGEMARRRGNGTPTRPRYQQAAPTERNSTSKSDWYMTGSTDV